MKPQSCFVTGTDTGVGKTLVSCALLQVFAANGLSVAGMKPVAAGCRNENGVLVSEDAEKLLAAGNLPLSLRQINPYAFELPVAPHIAAAMAGESVSLSSIHTAYEALSRQADVVVIEGAGGFRVPLNHKEDMSDLAQLIGVPVILVVGMRLGCLNHAMLTWEAILRRELTLGGWVANCIDPEMDLLAENLEALHALMPASCLGVIPYQENPSANSVAAVLMR